MQSIVLFGSQAQANLLEFSHTMIEHVQRKDAGEMGQILADLMLKLDQVNPDDLQMKNKGFSPGCLKGYPVLCRKCFRNIKRQVCRLTVSAEGWNILKCAVE